VQLFTVTDAGERVIVRYEKEAIMLVLKLDLLADGPEVVADMYLSGWLYS
jgi:hypothetical protein